MPFLLSICVSVPPHARQAQRAGRHPKVEMPGGAFLVASSTKVPLRPVPRSPDSCLPPLGRRGFDPCIR